MKRLSQLLNKQIRRTFSSTDKEQQLIQQHLKDWLIQKQLLPLKTEWEMIQASPILQGVSNKIAIERAYIKIMDGMENYWNVLDYTERVRLLNIDLQPTYESLPTFTYDEKTLIIPFFEERLNAIYQQEMVMFEMKQYRRFLHDYKEWILPVSPYGFSMFDGVFVSAKLIAQRDADYVMYHPHLYKLFAYLGGEVLVFPLFDVSSSPYVLSDEILAQLASFLLAQDGEGFLNECVSKQLYASENKEKIWKKCQKKRFLF